MIHLPLDANRNDIDQWCSRCVVMVKNEEDDEYVPAWYQGFEPESRTVVVTEVVSQRTSSVPIARVAVHWPLCGSVNLPTPSYAVHCARLTQKQYRRSWNLGQLDIDIPRRWDVAKFTGSHPEFLKPHPHALAKACFLPEYPSVAEAYGMIDRGERVTVAINRHVIVAGDASGKRMFYYHGELTATACNGTIYPVGDMRGLQRVLKATGGVLNAA